MMVLENQSAEPWRAAAPQSKPQAQSKKSGEKAATRPDGMTGTVGDLLGKNKYELRG